jgi:outer membrane protein assembly factor BamB
MRRWALYVVLVGVAVVAAGCDWPMVGSGPGGSNFNPETAISTTNVKNLAVRWGVSVAAGSRTPVVGSGTVVFDGRAFNASTGQDQWTTTLIRGPSAVADDLVHGSTNAITPSGCDCGVIRALDVRTGVQKWSRSTAPPAGAPLVADGLVVQELATAIHGSETNELDVLDANTGAFVWGTEIDPSGVPAVANGLLYVSVFRYQQDPAGRDLYAYDERTGELRWKVDTGNECSAGPIAANGKVYANGRTFDAASGRFLWAWPVCSARLTITPRTALAPILTAQSQPRLVAFDANNGGLRWAMPWIVGYDSTHPNGLLGGPPAAENGVLFGVAVGNRDGNHLIAFGESDHATLWEQNEQGFDYGAPIVANGIVYAVSGPGSFGTTGRLDAFSVP